MAHQGFGITNMTRETVSSLQLEHMSYLVLALQEENEKLCKPSEQVIIKRYDEHLERLERDLYLNKQYQRRDISGVPMSVPGANIEVINIFKTANVKVRSKSPGAVDIQAVRRKGMII